MADETATKKQTNLLRTTLVVAAAVVPAGTVIIGVPYLVYRIRRRRREEGA